MTSVDCHLWHDLDSPRKHASMCIPEKLSMLDCFWACPWRMTLMRLVEVGRSAYCEWHHSLGWLLDCITRRKCVKHRHSLLSSSDTDRTWPHALSSCCLHFPTLTMGQNKPFAFTGLFIIIARAARLEQHTQVYSTWVPQVTENRVPISISNTFLCPNPGLSLPSQTTDSNKDILRWNRRQCARTMLSW